MSQIWSDKNKFKQWLIVELAVIQAMVDLGDLSADIYQRIKKQAKVTNKLLKRIAVLDKIHHHDLLAFVYAISEQLNEDLRKYFHRDITSYDTEEPALALMMDQSLQIVIDEGIKLGKLLTNKALDYKYTIKIERTHGQHAEPTT